MTAKELIEQQLEDRTVSEALRGPATEFLGELSEVDTKIHNLGGHLAPLFALFDRVAKKKAITRSGLQTVRQAKSNITAAYKTLEQSHRGLTKTLRVVVDVEGGRVTDVMSANS